MRRHRNAMDIPWPLRSGYRFLAPISVAGRDTPEWREVVLLDWRDIPTEYWKEKRNAFKLFHSDGAPYTQYTRHQDHVRGDFWPGDTGWVLIAAHLYDRLQTNPEWGEVAP